MRHIRRPVSGGDPSTETVARSTPDLERSAPAPGLGSGDAAQAALAADTLLADFEPESLAMTDLELPVLDGLGLSTASAEEHAEHDHSAHAPIAGLAAASQDNPLRRQSDPLPAVEPGVELSRVVCGIRISGSGISPSALDAAQRVVETLVGGNPAVAQRMAEKKVRVVIVPAGTDVPDLADFAGIEGLEVRDADGVDESTLTEEERAARAASARNWRDTRGVGGHHLPDGDIVVGFPEENLIDSAGRYDTYGDKQNISVHEFAHQVHLSGMSDAQNAEIAALYEARKAAGGFTDDYAAGHPEEYFAQATQYFFASSDYSGRFDSHSDIDNPNDGPAWLQRNDPDLYAFLVRLYGEPHEGLDRASAVEVGRSGSATPVVPMGPPAA